MIYTIATYKHRNAVKYLKISAKKLNPSAKEALAAFRFYHIFWLNRMHEQKDDCHGGFRP